MVTSPGTSQPVSHREDCLVRDVLARVGDKWSVFVIHLLAGGTLRFTDLRRSIAGISQRMLTVTLRGLERDGLVRREVFAQVPPRVEYSLTPLGESLREVVAELVNWSDAHTRDIAESRARYDASALAAKE